MGLEISNGKLRVSAGYDLKVPLEADYAMQSAHFALSLEFDADGDSTAVIAAGEKLEADLAAQVKLAVFAQLGVDFREDANGMLQPVVTPKAKSTGQPTTPPSSSSPSQSQGTGGGGSRQYGKPKADVTKQPIVTFDDGRGDGLHAFYDLRSLKADGTYKQGAADFRSVSEGTKRQAWIWKKDGSPDDQIQAALSTAGISF